MVQRANDYRLHTSPKASILFILGECDGNTGTLSCDTGTHVEEYSKSIQAGCSKNTPSTIKSIASTSASVRIWSETRALVFPPGPKGQASLSDLGHCEDTLIERTVRVELRVVRRVHDSWSISRYTVSLGKRWTVARDNYLAESKGSKPCGCMMSSIKTFRKTDVAKSFHGRPVLESLYEDAILSRELVRP